MCRIKWLFCFSIFLFSIIFSSGTLAGKSFPYPVVCKEMERIGESLLQRDTMGFYFVDALGESFPVPNFVKVLSAEKSSSYEIEMRGWARPQQDIGSLGGQDIHVASNVCNWTVTMSFGSREALYEHAGSIESIKERSESEYLLGDMTVVKFSYPGLADISTVLAFNEEGYVSFTLDDADVAFWMIRLFYDLQKPK